MGSKPKSLIFGSISFGALVGAKIFGPHIGYAPWQRAQEEQSRREGVRQSAEQTAGSMSAGGLAGAIGMFGVMAGAVMGGPKAGRAALTKLGKSLKGGTADDAYRALKGGSKSADEGVTSAKKLARESDDFTQGASADKALIGQSRAEGQTDYFEKAVNQSSSGLTAGEKVGAAARREAEAAGMEGGSASSSRFLSTSGLKPAAQLPIRGKGRREAKQAQ